MHDARAHHHVTTHCLTMYSRQLAAHGLSVGFGPSYASGALPLGQAGLLGGGQRVVPPWASRVPAGHAGLSKPDRGPYPRPCQLAQSSRNLLFHYSAQGAHTQCVHRPDRGRSETPTVRGAFKPNAASFRVAIHTREIDGISSTTGGTSCIACVPFNGVVWLKKAPGKPRSYF